MNGVIKMKKIVPVAIILMMVIVSFGAVGTSVNTKDDEKAPIMSSERGSTKALIVGVSDYEPAGSGGPDLNYCDDDAEDMKDVLLDGGWSQSDITMLKDSQATEANIKSNLNSIASSTTSTSLSVFSFSGHGTQSGGKEAICPHDINSNLIYDDELNAILDNFNGRVVCIIDTCHAGGMGPDGGKGNESEFNATQFTMNFIETLGAGNENRVILMACAANELSYEHPDLENGVFTYYVVEGLEGAADSNSDGKITAEETFDYAEPKTTAFKPSQHPQIYDGDSSAEVPIIGGGGGDNSFEIIKCGQDTYKRSGNCENSGDCELWMGEDPFGSDATAWYRFDVGLQQAVKEMTVRVRIKEDGWLGNGADLYIYNWEDKKYKELSGNDWANHNDYKWYSFNVGDPSVYVKQSTGEVELKVYADANDFVHLNKIGVQGTYATPDLELVSGNLKFNDASPSQKVTKEIKIKNAGDAGSKLDWKKYDNPDWGSWSFSPSSGDDLTPEDGSVTIKVTLTAPNPSETTDYTGEVVFINEADSGDKIVLQASIHVEKSRARSYNLIEKLLSNYPILAQLLQLL